MKYCGRFEEKMFASLFNNKFIHPLIDMRSTKSTEGFSIGVLGRDRHICDCDGSGDFLTQHPDEKDGLLF